MRALSIAFGRGLVVVRAGFRGWVPLDWRARDAARGLTPSRRARRPRRGSVMTYIVQASAEWPVFWRRDGPSCRGESFEWTLELHGSYSATMAAKATVVVPSYNTAATIRQLLDALLAQEGFDRVDAVIVVDSSDDGKTQDIVREYQAEGVRLIVSGVRVMPARQRNIGARAATSELLVFIDADAFPAAGWLKAILRAYDGGILVGGGSYAVPDFQQQSAIALAQYYLEFNEYIPVGAPRPKRMLPTCNLFCDRALFERVGGVPEIRASEDTLFGLRVSEQHPVMFIPEATVNHQFRVDPGHCFANQELLGKYVYVYRRYVYKPRYLEPNWVALTWPLLLGVKLCRILPRIVQAGPVHWKPFAKSVPLFAKGLAHWGIGFRQGSREYDELIATFAEADAVNTTAAEVSAAEESASGASAAKRQSNI